MSSFNNLDKTQQKELRLSRLQEGTSIFLKNMMFQAVIGCDAWGRDLKAQPVILTIRAFRDVVVQGDNITMTLNYSQMSKDILKLVKQSESPSGFLSVGQFSLELWGLGRKEWHLKGMIVEIRLPKAILQSDRGLTHYDAYVNDKDSPFLKDEIRIEALKAACIIGIHPHERQEKQTVEINIKLGDIQHIGRLDQITEDQRGWWIRHLSKHVLNIIEASAFETVEALVAHVLDDVMDGVTFIGWITLSIEKPSALPFVEGAGVTMTRRGSQLS